MTYENIQYIQNANKTYPQWNDITTEMTQKFKGFHQILCADGYNIKACNIAEKDGKLFWILLDENKENFKLEQYGFLKNEYDVPTENDEDKDCTCGHDGQYGCDSCFPESCSYLKK